MIKLKDILKEISRKSFNDIAKSSYSKLSDEEILALRSWVVNLNKPIGDYMNKTKAKKFIQNSSNIKNQSQNVIKKLFGDKPFNVYRAYFDKKGSGLRSYSVNEKEASKFSRFGDLDTKQITYKDVVAVPAISFYKWEDVGGYDNELEIVIKA
jgi:hypothetical protein